MYRKNKNSFSATFHQTSCLVFRLETHDQSVGLVIGRKDSENLVDYPERDAGTSVQEWRLARI